MGNEVSKIEEHLEDRENVRKISEDIVEITKADLINASNESITCETGDSPSTDTEDSKNRQIEESDKENRSSKVKLRLHKSKSTTFAGEVRKLRRS